MRLLVATVLVALVAALPVKDDAAVNTQNSASYAFALDFSQLIPIKNIKCFASQGYKTILVRAYNPTGQGSFDTSSYQNIKSANSANMGSEVYMTPQPNSKKLGYQQFDEMYNGLVKQGVNVRQIWIQVTAPAVWGSNVPANQEFIADIIYRAKSLALGVGIYTNQYDWAQITNNWTGPAVNLGVGLWYWNVLGSGVQSESPPDFIDFKSFGGWYNPTVKQFGQTENVCNMTVNRDVYPSSSGKVQLSLVVPLVENIKI